MDSPNQNLVLRKDGEENPVCSWPFPHIVVNNGRERDQVLSLLSMSVIGSVMTTKTKKAKPKKTDEAKLEKRYICIDQRLGRQVYSYYNEVLSDKEARNFEEHLVLCFRCQEIVFKLDAVFEAIRANREQWLSPEQVVRE